MPPDARGSSSKSRVLFIRTPTVTQQALLTFCKRVIDPTPFSQLTELEENGYRQFGLHPVVEALLTSGGRREQWLLGPTCGGEEVPGISPKSVRSD